MLSIIITAWREEKTIGQAVRCILDSKYSGLGKGKMDKDWELIVVAPDPETRQAAKDSLVELRISESKYKILTDEAKGKPAALNQCFKVAKGQYLLLTDGDVFLKEKAVSELVNLAESDSNIGGVTGRPMAEGKKDNLYDYMGALLADAAHHKRTIDLTNNPSGLSTRIVPKRKFFPLSGYIMLIKNIGWELPTNVLADDAYMSYVLHNKGYKLAYADKAVAMVKYPTNLKDYYIQKKRSTGGYVQLWEYGVVTNKTKSRSFWRELEYAWFPIRYAQSFRQLLWSLTLYPIRLWLWIQIYWERKIMRKNFQKTWQRVQSTK